MAGRPAATGQPSRRRRPDLTLPLPLRDPSSLAVPHPLPLPPTSAPSSSGAVGGDNVLRSLTPSPLIADLERVRRIGSGSGGTVWMVRHRVNGQLYALKNIHGHHENEVLRHIRREVLIMRNVDNPSVVRCHGFYDHGGEIQILLEYMDGGSLEGRRFADEAQLADVARQVLYGLAYLHRRRIVHRDIKPANLLINRAREVKIADFGVGRILAQTLDPCESAVGTIAYMSPERINTEMNDGLYDGQAGDIWSFGMSILEFYLGHFAYGEQLGRQGDWASLMMAICYGQPPKAPPSASPEFQDFISCCLQKEPGRRLKAAQLLSHPFITRSAGPSNAASVRGA